MERLSILVPDEAQLAVWQDACGALEADCTISASGSHNRAAATAALESGADYILLAGPGSSAAQLVEIWSLRGQGGCVAGEGPEGFSTWLSRVLISYFTMRWLPSGAPAFVLIRADKLRPLLGCMPEQGPVAIAFLAAAAEYAGHAVAWMPCAAAAQKGGLFAWFLLHLFTAYGPLLHAGERMRALEPNAAEKPDHGYHTPFEKLVGLFNHEIVSYVFFGLLTTVVAMGSFYLFSELLGKERFLADKNYLVANALSWVVAVLFAFVTNKLFVFSSRSWQAKVAGPEFVSFITARLFSLLVDMGLMFLFVSIISMHEMLAKFIVQIVIVIINYVFSKLFIFKGKKK